MLMVALTYHCSMYKIVTESISNITTLLFSLNIFANGTFIDLAMTVMCVMRLTHGMISMSVSFF